VAIAKEYLDGLKLLHERVINHAGVHEGAVTPAAHITIEPHGKGEAIYVGRGPNTHGLNVAHVSDPAYQWPDVARYIEAATTALPGLIAEIERLQGPDPLRPIGGPGSLGDRLMQEQQDAAFEERARAAWDRLQHLQTKP
jgi:hypothetical protein